MRRQNAFDLVRVFRPEAGEKPLLLILLLLLLSRWYSHDQISGKIPTCDCPIRQQ
jgi:hypothetical protein